MFNGQVASQVSHSGGRSKQIRNDSDSPLCRPVQTERSSLTNSTGKGYIPDGNREHALEGRHRDCTGSVPTSPLSSPVPGEAIQETEVLHLHPDEANEDTSRTAGVHFAHASSGPESGPIHTNGEGTSEHFRSRTGSIESTLNTYGSSNLSPTSAPLHPHFASSGGLEKEPDSYLLDDRNRSASVPYLGPLKRASTSLPHDHELDRDRSREDSVSSTSSYLRNNAFLGHRDSLKPIKHASSTATSSSPSLALYPTSAVASISSSLLTRHRDTFARINYRRRPASSVPKAVFEHLLQYLTFEEYKALRLVCRIWIPSLPQPQMPASYWIPGEILREIYSSLSPIDFDAARHSCKSWFLASLDRRLLASMSRQAGCYSSVQADLQAREEHSEVRRQSMNERIWADHDGRNIEDCHQPEVEDLVSDEWVYSKRLAIESMLSPEWRGISLKHSFTRSKDARARTTPIGTIEVSLVSKPRRRASDAPSLTPGSTFNVSGCGKFALVTCGRIVFVCELLRRKPGMLPLTRIVCPRKVLGVSMDTSSRRYAVAFLLEGRVGMCCSLTDGVGDAVPTNATQGESMQLGMSADVRGSNSASRTIRPTLSALPLRRAEVTSSTPGGQFYVSRASESFISPASNTIPGLGPDNPWFDDSFDQYNLVEQHLEMEEDNVSNVGIPIEDGPRTIYNNLCSFDDPPISVAICPQRRCVAFGCRMGIELHWVDALTGSDLNRWFPLAAPSDFLYFLPARHGVDSAKKLRLISSAAGPYAQMQTTRALRGSSPSRLNWRTSPHGSRRQSMTRLFFGNLPFPTSTTLYGIPGSVDQEPGTTSPEYAERERGVLRTVDCDHYRAVPLSDGAHLLFTDPDTGHLCLGSDAPLGGPTKLLRKVLCLPPDTDSTEAEPQQQQRPEDTLSRLWLMCYDAGKDLRWGVRIAAAYSDGRIMLYCVPSDIFEKMRKIRTGIDVWDEGAGVVGQSDLLMDNFMPGLFGTSHVNANTSSHAANEAGIQADMLPAYARSGSLLLRGIEIGRVIGGIVEALAVSCDFGGLRVWAFMQGGTVRMWSLFRRTRVSEENWIMGEGGIVRRKENIQDDDKEVSPKTTTVVPVKTPKGKQRSTSAGQDGEKQHIRFAGPGLDGAMDQAVGTYGSSEGGSGQTGSVKQDAPSTRPRNGIQSPKSEEPVSLLLVNESNSLKRYDWGCLSSNLEHAHDRLEITILSDWRGVRLLDVSLPLARPHLRCYVRVFADDQQPYTVLLERGRERSKIECCYWNGLVCLKTVRVASL